MNEITKTIAFVAVAVATSVVAWLTYPSLPSLSPGDMRGQKLIKDLDPVAAASMEIVQYDEGTATVKPFKVAQVKNRWTIPSHDNYPADAKDQLAEAAAGLMNLQVLETPSDESGSHSLYGVVDPDPKTMPAGATGVGTRVVMRDAHDKTLLALIIGKEVPGKSDLRYVRIVGQDPVYTVALQTNKISAKFEDWIEKNLLKMSSWDIKQVQIQDYSVDAARGTLDRRGELAMDYNDTGDPKWKLVKDQAADRNGRPVELKLAADEELDTAKLDALRTALDDLKIADVRPKPKGLSADLKTTGEIAKNSEAFQSLAEKGFFLAQVGDDMGLFSNQGEVRVVMKDGVEYLLRFGGVAGEGAADKKDDKKEEKKDGKDKEKKDDGKSGLNRYIFVTAQFNPDVIPKPQLEPLPEEKKPEEKKPEAKKVDEKKTEPAKPEAKPEAKKADEKKPEPAKPEVKPEAKKADAPKSDAPKADAKKGEPKKDGKKASDKKAEPKKDEPKKPAADAKKSTGMFGATVRFAADEKVVADEKKADEKKAEPAAADKKAEEKKEPEKKDAGADAKEAKPDLKAERERVEKENKRKQEEYDEKIKKGKERVKELNARFADWYYVISDDVYRKVHLGRGDLVKKKEKKDEKKDEHDGHDHAGHDHGPGMTPSDFEKLKSSMPGK